MAARLLILGGTAWLGHAVAAEAQRAGFGVTCLARGAAGKPPPGAQWVQADRTAPQAYDAVRAAPWDAVVDLASHPGQVHAAAQALAGSAGRYVLISSVSVYRDHHLAHQDETAPTVDPEPAQPQDPMPPYAQAKCGAEQAVLQAFGHSRTLLVRSGLLGGPGDTSDRSGYWPWRFARAAAAGQAPVLVPSGRGLWTQVLDVRDLACWVVHAVQAAHHGVVDAVGASTALDACLNQAGEVAGHAGPLVQAPADWLLAQGVAPWAGPDSLPLWVPGESHAGFGRRSGERALRLGLRRRTLADTFKDTLFWELQRSQGETPRRAGLSDSEQDRLLALHLSSTTADPEPPC